MLEQGILVAMLISLIRLATPVVIGSMGNLFSEQAGIMNMGAEGMMIIGAFAATVGTYYTSNPWFGVVCGILGGGLAGLLHGIISIEFGGIQNLSGLGLNMFIAGLTSFFLRAIFKSSISPSMKSLWTTSCLKDIPFVGNVLSVFSPMTYIAIVLVIIVAFVMNKTTFGLRIKAAGDDPQTLETAGVNVWKIRYQCVILCGMLVGFGGAYLSLGQLDVFMEGMVMGKGMLAFIAVKMGKYNPWGILGMAVMFSFFDAIQLQMQLSSQISLAPELIQCIPFVAAIIIMAINPGESNAPRALSTPYLKGKYKF